MRGDGGDGGAATSASLDRPHGVAVDAAGNLYIADLDNHRIRKVDTAGNISTVAGNGMAAYSGDGGQATSASLNRPEGVAVDTANNLYIADSFNNRIRKVDTAGVISTFAGTGNFGHSGDGGAATSAWFNTPYSVAVDAAGNLYIADYSNHRIRKVDTNNVITTVAGNGTAGYGGDGGAATSARLDFPTGVAADGAGNLYIADLNNNRIRKVNPDGVITTVAGTGTAGYNGDNRQAISAQLNAPYGVAADWTGNLYITDRSNNRIRQVAPDGVITTVAGTGTAGYGGDGGQATSAQLDGPWGVALDAARNLYIADRGNNRIRRVALPQIRVTLTAAPSAITSGQSTTLTWASPDAVSAEIDNGVGVVTPAAGGSVEVMPAADTTYTVTVTFADSSTASAEVTVTVAAAPTATLTADPATITVGQSATLRVASTNAVSAVIQPGDHTVTLDASGAGSVSVSPTTTTVYTLTVTDANTVTAAPTAALTADPATITAGQSATLTVASTNAVSAVIQPGAHTVTLDASGAGSVSVSPPTTTTYTLTVTDANNATAVDTATVTVTDAPSATLTADPATITVGQSSTLRVASTNAVSAVIQPGAHTVILDAAGAGSVSVSPSTTTEYTLTVTDANNVTAVDTAAVTVTDAPTAALTADPMEIVAGQSSTLTVASTNAVSAVIQPGNLTVTLDAAGAGSVSVSPTTTTEYTLTVTDANSFTVTATAAVTVTDRPSAALTADPATITAGQSSTLRVASTNAVSAVIQPGDISVTLDASGAGSVSVSPTATTEYTLTVTDANSFTAVATAVLTVTDRPTAALTADPATIAAGRSSTLRIASTNAVSAVIQPGNISVALDASGAGSAIVSPTATTEYTLTVTDANGAFATATAAVTVSGSAPQTPVETLGGDGEPGFSGDGGPASEARVDSPGGAVRDAAGNLYFADTGNHRIRKIDAEGMIATVAGNGMAGYDGDGGSARQAQLSSPADVALDAAGNLYIADTGNHRVRKVDALGTIATVTGNGMEGYGGDGGAADEAQLSSPRGVAVDGAGNLYIADTGNHRVRAVDAATQTIDTIAGDGAPGALNFPYDVAVDAAGNLYVADTSNHRVLASDGPFFAPKRSAKSAPQGRAQEPLSVPMLIPVAGAGTAGYNGDGGAAAEALLDSPAGVAVDAEGVLYIADTSNHRIRRVDAEGNIETVAGSGAAGYNGDGGAATATQLNAPAGIAVDEKGALYIMDTENHRIRKVDPPPVERPLAPGPAVRAQTFELLFVLPQDAAPATQEVVLYAEDGDADFLLQPAQGWIAVEPASGSLAEGEETTVEVTVDPAGLRVGLHEGRLYVRSEGRLTGRVRVALEVLPPEGPAVAERGVVNAAVMSALGRPGLFGAAALPVAPGSMVVVQGENFTSGGTIEAEDFPLPLSLGGIRVSFGGLEARLFAVGPQRIEAQLPSALGPAVLEAGGYTTATVAVETIEGGSYARRFPLAAHAPGVFTTSGQGSGQGAVVLAGAGALAAPRGAVGESRPARAGDVLEIYATGLGAVYPPIADGENSCGPDGVCLADGSNVILRRTAEQPRVSIGGVEVAEQDLLFSGLAPGLVAVNLVVVKAPQGIEPSSAAEVVIAVGGRASQPGVTIAVE